MAHRPLKLEIVYYKQPLLDEASTGLPFGKRSAPTLAYESYLFEEISLFWLLYCIRHGLTLNRWSLTVRWFSSLYYADAPRSCKVGRQYR